ncbi:hypothetical protein EVAR_70805_1 [Eumeta japonica]|uniref:Uncharacterized protein n=1 Tax=Eumeta variegata TaxID=151549 RepID=A0A4C1SF31_EUMVA|nr:hypothetical protein EVAR_70805_1 [Eumeta japonica]
MPAVRRGGVGVGVDGVGPAARSHRPAARASRSPSPSPATLLESHRLSAPHAVHAIDPQPSERRARPQRVHGPPRARYRIAPAAARAYCGTHAAAARTRMPPVSSFLPTRFCATIPFGGATRPPPFPLTDLHYPPLRREE